MNCSKPGCKSIYVGKSTKASNHARRNACRPVDVVTNLVEVSRLSFVKFFDIIFHENWFISYRFVIDGHRQNSFIVALRSYVDALKKGAELMNGG